MKRFLLMLIACSWMCASTANGQEASASDFQESMSWMGGKSRADTYKRFCEINVLIRPHPDKEIESFISKASKGDSESFAFVAFMVWSGYAGFKVDKVAGKLAMTTAMNKGSPSAAAFIAQTFQQSQAKSDDEKIDAMLSAIHWYGVSVGMGNKTAYDMSMKLIDALSMGDNKTKDDLFVIFNRGIAEGKRNKKP